MDKVSSLLQEVKPIYLKHRQQCKLYTQCYSVIALSILFFVPIIIGTQQERQHIDSIYATLYSDNDSMSIEHTDYYIDEFDAMGVI